MTFAPVDADTPIYRREDSAFHLRSTDTGIGSGRGRGRHESESSESRDLTGSGVTRPAVDVRSLPTLLLSDQQTSPERPSSQSTPPTSKVVEVLLGRGLTREEYESHRRIVMLARRAAARMYSPEDDARYELATERLRRLVPRVTAEEMDRLAEMATETRKILDENAELRRELGLDE